MESFKQMVNEALIDRCPWIVLDALGAFNVRVKLPFVYGFCGYRRFLRFLDESQWWPLDRLEGYQLDRLRQLLYYVFENVPFYREIFKRKNLHPEDFRSLKDLGMLPILTREDLKKHFNAFISGGFSQKEFSKRAELTFTSGSTGQPVSFYQDRNAVRLEWLYQQWRNDLVHLKRNNKFIRVWAKPFIDNNIGSVYSYDTYLQRKLSLSAISPDSDKLEQCLKIIKKYKPDCIYGMPSALYTLACYAKNNLYGDVKFKVFYSLAENLYSFQRLLIEKQFHCEIFNQLGSEEFMTIGIECDRHKGMHIDMRKGLLEVVDENGSLLENGQRGRIVFTGFNNYVFPLLRYDTGDIGSVSNVPCSCGRGLTIFKSFDGRHSEAMICKDKYVYPTALSNLVRSMINIKECQFVQENERSIIINIVKDNNYIQQDSETLINKLKLHIDNEINIHINFVDNISRTKMGKFRFVINCLNQGYRVQERIK